MVTEIRIKNTNVNFAKEMESLVHEDLAQRTGRVDEDVQKQGEAAGRYSTKAIAPKQVFQAEKTGEAGMDMHEILARQMGLEYVDLDDYPVNDLRILRMVSGDLAKQYRVFPIAYDEAEDTLTIAISDPSNPTIADDLHLTLGHNIHAVVAREGDVMDRINQHYGLGEESITSLLKEFSDEAEEQILETAGGRMIDLSDVGTIAQSQPVVKLANMILYKAIQDRASDIHIEPFENMLRVRYRVDGVLREMQSPPREMHGPLISRLKVSANLDISENRRPQDGRINLLLPNNREAELRVTTAPTVHGECMVMRVLDKSMMQIGIHQIGMSQDVLEGFLKEIRKPNGIILVTGPTGCGKTTTLYSAINEVKSTEEKLITTEDPVEYQMDGIIQININDNVGLTYARCLRSILRQDPDKILVGEIRDLETAQISIQAALTGHLVFSTLHTNSAAGTITRLIDMGVEPFLITSTLQAVIGQRLIRTICPNCKRPHVPTDEELVEFNVTRADIADIAFYEGAGCEECNYTGYKGRMGIFEFLRITEEICDLILERATTDDVHALAVKQGMASLRQDGWVKTCMGLTTFSEVASHTPSETPVSMRAAAKAEVLPVENSAPLLPGLV